MIIGSIRESDDEETRVALTPSVVNKLVKMGVRVFIERSFSKKAFFSDAMYLDVGAEIVDDPTYIYSKADVLLQVLPPTSFFQNILKVHQYLITDFSLMDLEEYSGKATLIRLENVPRTSIAQSIDVLSAQSTVRGYMGALKVLYYSPKMAPQMMTAAVSIKATEGLVVGASVAGLQAASVLKKMGVKVTIADIDEKVEELAKSVGAQFVKINEKKNYASIVSDKDFLITAVGYGRKSPKIINNEDLFFMKEGAVILDLTQNNVAERESIKSFGNRLFFRDIYMERTSPITASEFWANNMLNLMSLIKTPENLININYSYVLPMVYLPKIEKRERSGYSFNKKADDMVLPT